MVFLFVLFCPGHMSAYFTVGHCLVHVIICVLLSKETV